MKINRVLLYMLVWIIMGCNGKNHQWKGDTEEPFCLKKGDFLFQDNEGGELSRAIKKVTTGWCGADFTHVGLVVVKQEKLDNGEVLKKKFVLEAIREGVVETNLDEFLNRSLDSLRRPKVIVGRLKDEYRPLIERLMLYKDRYLGMPYNFSYIMNDSSYYCSQLLYKLFKKASGSEAFFELQPMTFIPSDDTSYFSCWADYYTDMGIDVPQGQPGINPGGISRSEKIDIVHCYGKPSGLSEADIINVNQKK